MYNFRWQSLASYIQRSNWQQEKLFNKRLTHRQGEHEACALKVEERGIQKAA